MRYTGAEIAKSAPKLDLFTAIVLSNQTCRNKFPGRKLELALNYKCL